MAYKIPYHQFPDFRPTNDLIPGNQQADNPVSFDLAPAWGPDLARLRSIVAGSMGLVQDQDWSPAVQQAVVAALENGQSAFVNTVTAVRGLTIPAAMALRAGLIGALPLVPGTTDPDPAAAVPVLDGFGFSRICGAVPAMACHVALKIMEISAKSEVDPRLFVQPSGSGGTGTPEATAGTAAPAHRTPRRRGTAGSGGRKAK
jgi:hypothetical protein